MRERKPCVAGHNSDLDCEYCEETMPDTEREIQSGSITIVHSATRTETFAISPELYGRLAKVAESRRMTFGQVIMSLISNVQPGGSPDHWTKTVGG